MLKLGGVTKDDVVYDLGCGDGRIVVTAAKQFGARGVGVDIDPQRIKESEANAKAAGVEHVYAEDADSRGHRVSTDPKTLEAIYAFFARHLAD